MAHNPATDSTTSRFGSAGWLFLDAVSRGSEKDLLAVRTSILSSDLHKHTDRLNPLLDLVENALLLFSKDTFTEEMRKTDKVLRRMLQMLATAGTRNPVPAENLTERLMVHIGEVEAAGRVLLKHGLVLRLWDGENRNRNVRWSINKDGVKFLEELKDS